jgi:hypothetical protein
MTRLWCLLFPAASPRAPWNLWASALLLLGIAVWSRPYFTISVYDLGFDPGVMHGVHLVIHEAGHAICMMVGAPEVVVFFMGSGLQVLLPLCIAGAFYFKNHDAYGAGLCLWWTGHAALDIAPYIADARALELPLLSGGTGREVEGHDWEYLLTHWDALHLDTLIGARVAFAGRLAMALGLGWAAATLLYEAWQRRAHAAAETS